MYVVVTCIYYLKKKKAFYCYTADIVAIRALDRLCCHLPVLIGVL